MIKTKQKSFQESIISILVNSHLYSPNTHNDTHALKCIFYALNSE